MGSTFRCNDFFHNAAERMSDRHLRHTASQMSRSFPPKYSKTLNITSSFHLSDLSWILLISSDSPENYDESRIDCLMNVIFDECASAQTPVLQPLFDPDTVYNWSMTLVPAKGKRGRPNAIPCHGQRALKQGPVVCAAQNCESRL